MMLQKPVNPQGKWIMDSKKGLKIYDGIGELIIWEMDIEKSKNIGYTVFDDFCDEGEGINTIFESNELKDKMNNEWNFYNSHCTECEKKLPKKHYNYEGMNLCTRCYNKKDTWFNVNFRMV
jgi:hypothetical protein